MLDLWISELDAMRRYGCLFVLTCHPFLSGRPHRVEVLRTLIEHALATGDVEFATCRDVARRAREDPDLDRRLLTPVEIEPGLYPDEPAGARQLPRPSATLAMSITASLAISASGIVFAKPSAERTGPSARATATSPM